MNVLNIMYEIFYIDLRKAFDTITCVLFCDTLFQEEKKLK